MPERLPEQLGIEETKFPGDITMPELRGMTVQPAAPELGYRRGDQLVVVARCTAPGCIRAWEVELTVTEELGLWYAEISRGSANALKQHSDSHTRRPELRALDETKGVRRRDGRKAATGEGE